MNKFEHRKDIIPLTIRLMDIDLSLMEPMKPTMTMAADRMVTQPPSVRMK